MKIPVILIFIISAKIAVAAGWQENLDSLLVAATSARQDTLIEAVVRLNPDWQEVMHRLQSITFPDAPKGELVQNQILGIDGVTRPWIIYVPSTYDPRKPTPLMVALHGGVSSPKIMDDPAGWVAKTPFKAMAESRGYLMLFPFGQAGATWWDEVGMTNIQTQVRIAKAQYNVDDDRVFLGGFSDGGSAAFLFAMAMPSDFAAFVALNGHIGVASEDGNLPTYATNFANVPVYTVTTDKDQLYPSAEMQPIIEMARKAGGNIYYRQLEGDHSLSYAADEFPRIADFLERHPRDPFPTNIVWETAIKGFGVFRWFAIDEITVGNPATWYHDYNLAEVDSTIAIGFMPDDGFAGPGVRVASIVEGDVLARRLQLAAGDIIVKANGVDIKSMDDLIKFKTTIRRGDPVSIYVRRGQEEIILKGNMPASRNYYIFKREQPSAQARVSFSANIIDIETSRVGAFRVLIHPEMINLKQKLVINIDGKKVFDKIIEPDLSYLLRDFVNNRDRKVIFVNEVRIEL
jgi:predicted esterase